MAYSTLATRRAPALIIYVLDVSASMNLPLGGKTRIEVVSDALLAVFKQMVARSTKGVRVSPRYHIAMYAYSNDVYDLLGGIQPIDVVVKKGVPRLQTMRQTDSALAFGGVERLLKKNLAKYDKCPAPLVCHMTDGNYTGADPTPIVERIRNMRVKDGNVLVENIFISDDVINVTSDNIQQWQGITPVSKLGSSYANHLRSLSSPVPAGYRGMMREMGYNISNDALMMFPGTSPELVEMGFVMSMATPIRRR